MSLQDWTNVSIIFLAIVMGAFLIIATIITVVIGLLSRALLTRINGMVDDDLKPMLTNVKDTSANVRGTAEYVSESTVKPIVRAYGVVAGVRRAAGVISGLAGFGDEKRPGP